MSGPMNDWIDQTDPNGFDSVMRSIVDERRYKENQRMGRIMFAQQFGQDPKALMQSMDAQRPVNQAMASQPASMMAAQQPPGMAPNGPQMGIPSMQAGMSGQMMPQAPQQQPQDLWQHFLSQQQQKMGQQQQMGQQAGQANLNLTQSQARLHNADASLRERGIVGRGGAGGLTPDQHAALGKALEEGRLAPAQMTARGEKLSSLADEFIKNPNYNAAKADTNFKGATSGASAGARYQASGDPQALGRLANSTRKVITMAIKASDDFPRFGAQFMNTPYIKIASQTSSQAMRFKGIVNDLRSHIASIYSRGKAQQKEDKDAAIEAIPDSITPSQLKDMAPYWNQIVDTQVEGIMTPVGPGDVKAASGRLDAAGLGDGKPKKIGRFQIEVH